MLDAIIEIFQLIIMIIIIIFFIKIIISGNNETNDNLKNNDNNYRQNYYDFNFVKKDENYKLNKRINEDDHNKKFMKDINFRKEEIFKKDSIYYLIDNNYIEDDKYYDEKKYRYIKNQIGSINKNSNDIIDNSFNYQDNTYKKYFDNNSYNKKNYLNSSRNYYKNLIDYRKDDKNNNKNNNKIINIASYPEINYFKEIEYNKDEYYEKKTLEDKKKYGYMYILPKINERLIIVDTEVTGKYDEDRIIEICAREMINGLMTKKTFHSFFKPKSFMTEAKIKFHKIPKKAFYYNPEEERKIWIKFLNFINNSLIITHNAVYDMKKINKELEYNNLPLIYYKQFRCSMRIFLDKNPFFSKKFSKLKECCEKYKIRYNNRNLHTATYDSLLLGKIMEKIYEEELIKDKRNNNLITNKKINDNNNYKNINIKGKNEVNKGKNNKDDNLEKENKEKKELEMKKFIDNNIESIIEELELETFINENLESIIKEFKENKENDNNKELKKDKIDSSNFLGKKRI